MTGSAWGKDVSLLRGFSAFSHADTPCTCELYGWCARCGR